MNTIDVIMVKIYITEASHMLNKIVDYLKNEVHIRGVSVFRAISGFGATGDHNSSLIDLLPDLPLVLEFFDTDKDKIEKAVSYFSTILKPEHIIFWNAQANE